MKRVKRVDTIFWRTSRYVAHEAKMVVYNVEFRKKAFKVGIFSMILIAFFSYFGSSFLFTKDARAANTCTWTGAVNANWSNAGNWTSCGGVAPQTADTTSFTSGSVASTVDTTYTVAALTINGYTGTTTLGANLTVNGDLSLQSGTLAGASYTINVGGNWDSSSGTFTYSTSTVNMTGTGKTLNTGTGAVAGKFYGLTIASGATISVTSTNGFAAPVLTISGQLTVNSGQTIQNATNGTLTINSSGILTGAGSFFKGYSATTPAITLNGTISIATFTYNVAGTVTIPAVTYGGNLNLRGSGTQTGTLGTGTLTVGGTIYLYDGYTSTGGVLTVDASTNNTIVNCGNLVIGYGGDFLTTPDVYATAILEMGSGVLTVTGDTTIYLSNGIPGSSGPAGSNKLIASGNIYIGGDWTNDDIFTANSSTVYFNGSGTQSVDAGSSSFYGLTHSGSGMMQLTSALTVTNALTNSAGTLYLNTYTLTATGATFSNNNGTFKLRGSETITGLTQDASYGTWLYVGDGDSAADTYDIKNYTYYNLTINSTDGVTDIFRLPTANLTVNGAYTLTAGTFNANTLTTTVTGLATVSGGTYSASTNTQNFNGGLTVSSGSFSGNTGTVNATNVTIAGGTLTAPSTNLNVSGNWSRTGTFTHNSGTVTFNGTVAQTITGTNTWNNLTINNTYASPDDTNDVDPASAQTVSGTLTVTDGQWTPMTGDIYVAVTIGAAGIMKPDASASISVSGSWSRTGSFTHNSGTVTFNGTVAQTITGTNTWNNLTINNTYASPDDTNDVDPNAKQTVAGTLTVTDGQWTPYSTDTYYNVSIGTNGIMKPDSAASISVSGNWANSGTFTSNSGTITFNKTSTTQTLNSGGSSFYNITHSGAGTLQLTSALTVTNDFTNSSGTFDTKSGSNYAVNVTRDFIHSSGIVTAQASTITVGRNFTAYGVTSSTGYNNASIVLNGTGNLTYTSLSSPWSNGFKNLTCGQSGNTTTLTTGISLISSLTIGTGTLTGAQTVSIDGAGNFFNFNASSTFSVYMVDFYANANVPTLTNGYSTNLNSGGSNVTPVQTGAVTLNSGKSLNIICDGVASRTCGWNTGGYDLTVGGNINVGNYNNNTGVLTGGGSTITLTDSGYTFGINTASSSFTTTGTVSFTASSGTQSFWSAASVSLKNLTHSGAGTLQAWSGMVITGTFTNSNGTYDTNGQTTTVTGLTTVSGGIYSASTATQAFNGGLTINGGTFTGSTGAVNVTDAIISSGTFTGGSGDITLSGIYTLSGGSFTSTSGTLTVGSTFNRSATATFAHNSGTVKFLINGASGYNITTNGITFYNLVFDKTSGATEIYLYLQDSFTVAGDLTAQNNTNTNYWVNASGTPTVTVSGDLNFPNTPSSSGWTAYGTWTPTENFTTNLVGDYTSSDDGVLINGNVTLDGTSDQTINNTSALDIYSQTFKIDKSSGIAKLGSNITFGNTLDIHVGTLDATTSNYNLTLEGPSWINDGTFNGRQGTFTVAYSQTLSGSGTYDFYNLTINPTRTMTAPSGNINVAGNWTNSGGFVHNSGTVTFTGTDIATISGDNTFNNLTMDTSTDGAKTIIFLESSIQTIEGTWTLDGASGKVLTLRSTSDMAGPWYFDIPSGFTSGDYIDVVDSYSVDTNKITAGANVTNSGNNDGWIFNQAPNSPSSLGQKKVTGGTTLSTGDWTNEAQVQFTASASDTDNPDTLYLCVEKNPIGTAFSNTEDSCGSGVAYSGTPVTVTNTISSQTDATEYHWQARVKDTAGAYSSWVVYGGNTDPNDRDYGIDTTAPTGGTVKDGNAPTGGDLDWNDGSLTQIKVNWDSTEPTATVSGLQKYEYAIRRQSDGYYWSVCSGAGSWQSGANWCNNTTSTSFTQNSLNLQTGVTYYVSLKTTDNAGNSATINSNGIQVTPTLSFSMDSNAITFADLNNANNWTDTKTTTFTTSTNASSGYTIQGFMDQLLTNPYSGTITSFVGTGSASWAAPDLWNNTCNSGGSSYCGFGYTSNDGYVQGLNRFNSGTEFAPYKLSGPGDVFADHVGPVNGSTGSVSNQQWTVTHKVSVPTSQAAAQYSGILTVIITANF